MAFISATASITRVRAARRAAEDLLTRVGRGEAPWLRRDWLESAGTDILRVPVSGSYDPHEAFHDLFAATGMDSAHGALVTFYSLGDDMIHLASFWREDPDRYVGDWIHELVHATGHRTRLDRDLPVVFGPHTCGVEDLVAEIGTAIVCHGLGLSPYLRHPGSLHSWAELIRSDPSVAEEALLKARAAAAWLFARRDAHAAAYERYVAEEAEAERDIVAAVAAARRARRTRESERWAERYATVRRSGESLLTRRRGGRI